MQFFGIDLGTSKCSIAYAVHSPRPNYVPQPNVIEFRENSRRGTKSPVVPSVVARPIGGRPNQGMLFGFEAQDEIDQGRVRGHSYQDVFRSVKSHLGTGRSYVRADQGFNTPVKVWAALIQRLCEMTVAAKGDDFDPRRHPTVLTVPASFGIGQRAETLRAAQLAGFSVDKPDFVHLIDEPVAALIDTLNHADIDRHINQNSWNTVLVFDFGGGTCDLTLLKFRYDPSKPTGIDCRPQAISPYQQIGGDTIDLAIMHKIIWPQVCRQNGLERQLTATERKQIEDPLRYTVCRRLKEQLNESLKPMSPEQFRRQDWDGVSVELPLNGRAYIGEKEIVGNAKLSANDLYRVMEPFADPDPDSGPFTIGESNTCWPFAKLVETTMERAGLTAGDLDLLVLHGGSCMSPFVPWAFEQMKEEGFLAAKCRIIETPNQITSVSRGAALAGCLSKKYGKPYIQPIVPEEMSVLTVGNEYVYLVHAGDGLPYKKTFDKKEFRLSTDGQDEIVVPIYIGYDANRRRLASTLIIPIKQRLVQSHPVEVELAIDTDKKSFWRFRPKGYDWSDIREVPNPWIGCEPTENAIKLQDTRTKIRALVDADQKPAARMLADEALLAARAGYSEEGLALIEDLLSANPKSSIAWHNKALIHGQRKEYVPTLESYAKASALEPTDMVTRGNYGVALFWLKRHEEAVAVMREALSKNPSLTYLHSWLVEAFQALGNVEEMNKELEKRLVHARRQAVLHPEDVSVWEELRSAAIRIGRYDDAEVACESIRDLSSPRNLLAGANHG